MIVAIIRSLILAIAVHYALPTVSQQKPIFISARISIQSDYQKAAFKDIQFPYEFKEHTTSQLNWGVDLLFEKYISDRLSVHLGPGYFRNKFNFQRQYNHQLLNNGRDSLPIGTSTNNYIFHLVRLPVGITYQILKNSNWGFVLRLEDVVNFSVEQVYNGGKAFPDASNKYSSFNYYGNAVLLFAGISKQLKEKSVLELAPYVRLLNIYKRKDPYLYETNSKPYTRSLDAVGMSLKYAINLKK